MSGFANDPGTLQQEAGFGFDGRFWTESYNSAITAATAATQAGAAKLDSMVNYVTTVASAGNSVQLPPASKIGLSLVSVNVGANPMQIFGANGSTDTINGIAGATGVSQMASSVVWFSCPIPGKWVAQGLGSGFSGSQQTYNFQDAMSANAAGNQASGTPITTSIARFTTVGAAGYSATLMPATPGLAITVINADGNIIALFPASATQGGVAGGDAINSLGQNSGFAVPAGAVVDLYCTVAGTWHTIMSSTAPQQSYNAVAGNAAFQLTGAQITGGTTLTMVNLTGTLGSSGALTLPTVANLIAAMTVAGINPQPGMSYELDIYYPNGTNTWTVTTAAGWTLQGTMTITGAGLMRRFIVTLTSLTAAVLQSIGTVTLGAV
jgi:hypothetical protein